MKTNRSEQIIQNFLKQEIKYKRKKSEISGSIEATPQEIFPLLCPTREADWIPGWNANLIYTKSGYAEDKCIFRTSDSNISGEGLWTCSVYKENEYIEYIKYQSDILVHLRISLKQENDNKTTISWSTVSTALTEKGNIMIEDSSNHNSGHSSTLIKLIKHYLIKQS